MKIYMVDDSIEKHEWFIEIVRRANERAGHERFVPAFGGDPAQSRENALNADRLWDAVLDKDAAYFVDLQLNKAVMRNDENFYFHAEMLNRFRRSQIPEIAESFREYSHGEMAHPSHPVSELRRNYVTAMLVMLAARAFKRPAILVSGEVSSKETRKLYAMHLVRRPAQEFPEDGIGALEPAEVDELAAPWVNEVLGLDDPVVAFRSRTNNWFSLGLDDGAGARWNSIAEHGLPHDLPAGNKESAFDPRCTEMSYAAAIQELFPGAPETWWNSKEAAKALHDCLKTALGCHAQWTSDAGNRPLSLAGAYVAFLMAVRAQSPQDLPKCYFPDWTAFIGRAGPLKFLPAMTHADAERAFICLVDFFRAVIQVKGDRVFCVADIKPPGRDGKFFSVKLTWPREDFKSFGNHIRDAAAKALDDGKLELPPAKTATAFFKFLLASQAQADGAGASAYIQFDNKDRSPTRYWLKVGAA